MLACLLLIASTQTATAELPALDALRAHGAEEFAPFSFVHIGDPQIGYGTTWPAARRFRQLAREVNAEGADFGIVVGDFVQDRLWLEKKLFRGALSSFDLPLAFIPGNHDVVDLATLQEYRAEFGADYYSFVYSGCGFLGLNSELLESIVSTEESVTQWEWLEAELARLRARPLRHLFVFLHRPVSDRQPESPSARLCDALVEAGVRHVLAGHLHSTRELEVADAFTIYTVGGTAKVHDERGYGYRVFEVTEDGVEERYVEFDRPSQHWLVRYGWSPRIVDPSLPHWLLTLVFLFTSRWCWRARRAVRAAEVAEGVDDEDRVLSLWTPLALAYLFLALNLQLDFDEVVAACGRSVVFKVGIAGERRFLQVILLAGGAFTLLLALVIFRRSLRRGGKLALWALAGASLPATSFLLHMLSLHQSEVLMYVTGRYGLYVIEGSGALLSARMAARARAYAESARASRS